MSNDIYNRYSNQDADFLKNGVKKPFVPGSIAANPLDAKTAEVKKAMGDNASWEKWQPNAPAAGTTFMSKLNNAAAAPVNFGTRVDVGSPDIAPYETYKSRAVDANNSAALAKPLPTVTSFAPTASAPLVSGGTSAVAPATNLSLSSASAPVGAAAAPAPTLSAAPAPAPAAPIQAPAKQSGFQAPSAAELAAFRKSTGSNFDVHSANDKLNLDRMRAQQDTLNSKQASAYRTSNPGYRPGMYVAQ